MNVEDFKTQSDEIVTMTLYNSSMLIFSDVIWGGPGIFQFLFTPWCEIDKPQFSNF